MGSLFSKKENKVNRITEQDKAILSLKQQRDKLKQYQKKINLNLEKEKEIAKKLLMDGKKEKAKLMLKKKRYQENLLQKTDSQLENIDKMIHEVEFSLIQIKVAEGLKQGNEALKKLHEMMSLEDVEKIMDDTKEAVEYQNEINALIGGVLSEEDENEILAELNELDKINELPSVPKHELIENSDTLITMQDTARKVKAKETPVAAS
ncbi:charged multivesicular body protein 6-A isoform X2 [Hydra vulgaris]|uniref:Charged multivesicular body protein 6-A isoform X2 n=1 Tax=Hydra vulgaris TaxID=6087 RepID=A0ABM4CDG0_HYDVU